MEQRADEAREATRNRAIEQLAGVVRGLVEERHEAQKHEGPFHKCIEAMCANVREAYLAL